MLFAPAKSKASAAKMACCFTFNNASEESASLAAPAPSAQGIIFDSVMKAASKEPLVKQYKAANQLANNPSVQKTAAMTGLALAAAGAGGPVGTAVANQAIKGAIQQQGGKKNKNRRKR